MKKLPFILLLIAGILLTAIKSHAVGLGVHLTSGVSLYTENDVLYKGQQGNEKFLGGGFTLRTTMTRSKFLAKAHAGKPPIRFEIDREKCQTGRLFT